MSLTTSLREYQTFTPQQWIDRVSQTLPRAVTVVLIVAIAWQLVQLTWLLLDRRSDNNPTFVAPVPALIAPAKSSFDIQTIVNAHLFDIPQAAEQTQVVSQAPVNLTLSAVFATSDPAKGLAIIGESGQPTKVYAVGAVLNGGRRLHQVFADHVLLDRGGGQLEELKLPKQNPAGLTLNRPQPQVAAQVSQPNQQFVDNIRRIAETDPSQFAQIVRAQPVFDKGVQRGFRVYPGRNRQLFARLGLQPGDLVLSINGTPLDDPQRAQEMFNTIASSDRVNVTVERNGQAQELTLNTAQISLPESNAPPPRGMPTPAPGTSVTPSPPVE